MSLYHVSLDDNLSILVPRIPEIACKGYEDVLTNRVCFADSINNCLRSIYALTGKSYYVYEAVDYDEIKIHYPTAEEVNDAFYTHEVWLLEPVKVKKIGCIYVSNVSEFFEVTNSKSPNNTTHGRNYTWDLEYDLKIITK